MKKKKLEKKTKNLKTFWHNNKGEVLEAILMIPVLLTVFFLLAFQVEQYRTKNNIEDTTKVVSRLIMQSNTLEEGIQNANNYIKTRADSKYYNLEKPDSENQVFFTIDNIDSLYDKESKNTYKDKAVMKSKFSEGDIVTFHIRRYSKNWDNRLNTFCFKGEKENCITLTKDHTTTYLTVIINGGANS